MSENVWNLKSNEAKVYHISQYKTPYESTKKFIDFLLERGILKDSNDSILDIGCGAGANLYHLSNVFTNMKLWGLDISEDTVNQGNELLKNQGKDDINLVCEDLFSNSSNLEVQFDGVISLQTLMAFDDIKEPLKAFASYNPKWIAFSSLFYEGDIDAHIVLTDRTRVIDGNIVEQSFNYNTYSIPRTLQILNDLGFTKIVYKPFEIEIDLVKPEKPRRQTYTETLISNKKIQISGPLLMNWFFFYAERD